MTGSTACFCGCVFPIEDEIAQCPYCGEAACMPNLSDEDVALLRADLDLMLEYPILADQDS